MTPVNISQITTLFIILKMPIKKKKHWHYFSVKVRNELQKFGPENITTRCLFFYHNL